MKSTVSMIAGAVLAVSFSGLASAAGQEAGAECYAPMSAYSAGLPKVDGFEAMSAEKRIVETTMVFRKAMSAAQDSQNCFEDAIAIADEGDLAELQRGAEESSLVFSQVQVEFGAKLDEMSGDVLSDVAPAAGADTMAATEEQSVAGMELLFDSYMALERSQEISRGLSKAARKS
ncbi:hypothetical protein [Kordiimonas sp.]|uniref:hypothetical protein n=1 Tax=Kordiimonas sp. TaxID=1970157 RepID=UPI003A929FA3